MGCYKDWSKFDEKQVIYIVSKYLSTDFLLISRGKMVTFQWRNLTQSTSTMIKVNITNSGTARHPVSPDGTHKEAHSIFYTPPRLPIDKRHGNMRKYQTNSKQLVCTLFKISVS